MWNQANNLLAGRYEMHEQLGQGGTASVHRAFDKQDQRWVAIKLLSPELGRYLSIQKRFEREANILSSLDHHGIVKVYGLEQTDAHHWITMELVNGQSLEHWRRRHGPMPTIMGVTIAIQICEGLKAAHRYGVIHRDIKPSNVLVTQTNMCKVVDFGLAVGPNCPRLTRTGLTMGTVGYMAPEQREDASRAGAAADLYSVGATLLALLSGQNITDIHQALEIVGDNIPLALSQVLVRATLPDPERRHSSIAQFYDRLCRLKGSLDTADPKTPPLHIPLTERHDGSSREMNTICLSDIETVQN